MQSHTLLRLEAICLSNSSSEKSAEDLKTPTSSDPALLKAQSSRPNRAIVRRISNSTSLDCETSVGMNSASAPSACTSWRTASPRSTPLLAMTTLAPSRAKLKAVARPMPELPPVMSATAPSKRLSLMTPPSMYRLLGKYSGRIVRVARREVTGCVVGNTEVEFSLAGCQVVTQVESNSIGQLVKFRLLQIMQSCHTLATSPSCWP